jgi:XTP/dITP diphosphohydrolase
VGRLVVLVTTPRVPAGLLSGAAWACLREASRVVTEDTGTEQAAALRAQDVDVQAMAPSAPELLRLAGAGDVVWLAADTGDDDLLECLAAEVVEASETGRPVPSVEVVVGSFDPVGARLLDLVAVMDRLRQDCPWDRRQTHESLVRYLVEETYETVEAIETGDREHLREELGDLLLQVVFHARLAQEHADEPFGIDDVAGGIVDKLVRRHPHVFAPGAEAQTGRQHPDVDSADGVQTQWDAIKAAEKSRSSVLDGIPPGLPALSLAATVLDRAGGSHGRQTEATAPGGDVHTEQTLGDALFDLVSAAQAAGLDAESALRRRVRQEAAEVRGSEQRATTAAAPEPG